MKLTPIDRKEIVAAIQSGSSSVAELSSEHGIARAHVTAVYRKETGTSLKPYKKLSQPEKDAILAELQAHKMPINKLAALYGVTPPQISYLYKKRMGRPLRPFPIWKLSAQEKEAIVTEYTLPLLIVS